jgi:hypothetical protein
MVTSLMHAEALDGHFQDVRKTFTNVFGCQTARLFFIKVDGCLDVRFTHGSWMLCEGAHRNPASKKDPK